MAHILVDVLKPLVKMNVHHNNPGTLSCEISNDWAILNSKLNALKETDGEFEAEFWEKLDKDQKKFSEIPVHSGTQNFGVLIDRLKTRKAEMLEFMETQVQSRTPTQESVFFHFSVLNLNTFPSNADERKRFLVQRVGPSLEFLFNHFKHKSAQSYNQETGEIEHRIVNLWPEWASAAQLKLEYRSLEKAFLKQKSTLLSQRNSRAGIERREVEAGEEEFENYSLPANLLTMQQAFEAILTEFSGENPLLCLLITLMLVYPTNSCGPERIFSELTFLKTKLRNRLGEVTVNDLIHIRKNPLESVELDTKSILAKLSVRAPTEL